ncbi:MAG TPA: Sec-independent protein translocase protein TatB [Methylophilaceae bacterium]
MFDIAFTELVVIAIVALIVVGPEKLPRAARTVGSLLGRMQRYVATVRQDIERELQMAELKKMQQDVERNARLMQNEVENIIHAGAAELRDTSATPSDNIPSQPNNGPDGGKT